MKPQFEVSLRHLIWPLHVNYFELIYTLLFASGDKDTACSSNMEKPTAPAAVQVHKRLSLTCSSIPVSSAEEGSSTSSVRSVNEVHYSLQQFWKYSSLSDAGFELYLLHDISGRITLFLWQNEGIIMKPFYWQQLRLVFDFGRGLAFMPWALGLYSIVLSHSLCL